MLYCVIRGGRGQTVSAELDGHTSCFKCTPYDVEYLSETVGGLEDDGEKIEDLYSFWQNTRTWQIGRMDEQTDTAWRRIGRDTHSVAW